MGIRVIAGIASVGALIGALLLAPAAIGAPGDLDPTFSRDGKLRTEIRGKEAAASAVLADDGGIFVGGHRWIEGTLRTKPFVLALEADGDRRSTFGDDGVVRLPRPANEELYYRVSDLDRLPGDSILVTVSSGFGSGDAIVFKLSGRGELDAGFGQGGSVALAGDDGRADHPPRVVVAPGGDFYGLKRDEIHRYTGSGELDASFEPVADVGASIHDIALLQDGSLLALEQPPNWGKRSDLPDYRISRWDDAGVLDAGFGDAGRVEGVLGSELHWSQEPESLLLGPSEAIYVAGTSREDWIYGSLSVPTFARHLVDGEQDPDWGEGGNLRLGSSLGGLAFTIGPDELPLAAGGRDCGRLASDYCGDLTAVRVDSSGAPDPSFGSGASGPGTLRYDLFRDRLDIGEAADVDPAGRIVVAGSSDGDERAAAVVRMLSGPGPHDRDADGVGDTDDRCPQSYGPAERAGCPRFGRRVGRLRLRRKNSAPPLLRGRVKSGHPRCRVAEVSIRRKRRHGADREIASAESLPGLRYSSSATFEVEVPRGYRGPDSPTVYAVAKRSRLDAGICRRARSPLLRRTGKR